MKVYFLSKIYQTPPTPPLKFRSKYKITIFKNSLYILYTITKMTSKKDLVSYIMDNLPWKVKQEIGKKKLKYHI